MAERHCFERGHEQGIFARMMADLAAEYGEEKTVMNEALSAIGSRPMPNATHLKAHHTATRLGVKFGGSENSPGDCFPDGRGVGA